MKTKQSRTKEMQQKIAENKEKMEEEKANE